MLNCASFRAKKKNLFKDPCCNQYYASTSHRHPFTAALGRSALCLCLCFAKTVSYEPHWMYFNALLFYGCIAVIKQQGEILCNATCFFPSLFLSEPQNQNGVSQSVTRVCSDCMTHSAPSKANAELVSLPLSSPRAPFSLYTTFTFDTTDALRVILGQINPTCL